MGNNMKLYTLHAFFLYSIFDWVFFLFLNVENDKPEGTFYF